MGWPSRLVLVRHAESEGNVLKVDERATFDVATHKYGLTERGRRQAEITGEYLKQKFPKGFDVHYVSYYQRSRDTMKIMYPDVEPYEDPRLAEGQRGIYHSLTSVQIKAQFPDEIKRKEREGLYHYRPWGGENWADIELRIHSFLTTLTRDYDGQDVLIVAHGQWLILFQRLIHHFSIDEAIDRYRGYAAGRPVFENASVTIYEGQMINNKSRLQVREQNIVPWKGRE